MVHSTVLPFHPFSLSIGVSSIVIHAIPSIILPFHLPFLIHLSIPSRSSFHSISFPSLSFLLWCWHSIIITTKPPREEIHWLQRYFLYNNSNTRRKRIAPRGCQKSNKLYNNTDVMAQTARVHPHADWIERRRPLQIVAEIAIRLFPHRRYVSAAGVGRSSRHQALSSWSCRQRPAGI